MRLDVDKGVPMSAGSPTWRSAWARAARPSLAPPRAPRTRARIVHSAPAEPTTIEFRNESLAQADVFVLLDHVQFERRNYQNRTLVRNGDEAVLAALPEIGGEGA